MARRVAMKRSVWALALFLIYQILLLAILILCWLMALGAGLDVHSYRSETPAGFLLTDWLLPIALAIPSSLIILWFSYLGHRAYQSTDRD